MDEQEQSELFRERTRDVLLALRAQYLAGGANALKHWAQLESRARAALRTRSTAGRWASEMCRRLGVGAPSPALSRSILSLEADVDGRGLSRAWRAAMSFELPLVLAEARLEAEVRKERAEQQEETEDA